MLCKEYIISILRAKQKNMQSSIKAELDGRKFIRKANRWAGIVAMSFIFGYFIAHIIAYFAYFN